MDRQQKQLIYSESDMRNIKQQLKDIEEALVFERQQYSDILNYYVSELHKKQRLYRNEIALRNDQLRKVQKTLLYVEARLFQEQRTISFQLYEKDHIISKQNRRIKKLLSSRKIICANCQLSEKANLPHFNSCPPSIVTDQDNDQSSNAESLGSNNEMDTLFYKHSADKGIGSNKLNNKTLSSKCDLNMKKDDTNSKTIETYFKVLQHQNNISISNEDDIRTGCNKVKSIDTESISDKLSFSSDNLLSKISTDSDCSLNISSSECEKTVINAKSENYRDYANKSSNKDLETTNTKKQENDLKLTELIPFFEDGGNLNDNWYASASDQEDEELRDIYRNNPVLECMNQILLRNISDVHSPPKTPNTERKNVSNNVKSSDAEIDCDKAHSEHDYYETPIQRTPNFYESPQSVYSNDYEQILSKFSDSLSDNSKSDNSVNKCVQKKNNYYIEMENSSDEVVGVKRKNKIRRTPPALPPKPPNLVLKCKIPKMIRNMHRVPSEPNSIDLEPDYCSISELNLPPVNNVAMKLINVIADVHVSDNDDQALIEKNGKNLEEANIHNHNSPNAEVGKCVAKFNNIQLANQVSLKTEQIQSLKKKINVEIPKLPQVSEIIFPDESEIKNEELVCYDNYVKNNTQITKTKNHSSSYNGKVPDISSLINTFEDNQILKDIKRKHEMLANGKPSASSSFHVSQNADKQAITGKSQVNPVLSIHSHPDTKFDLSHNFEEFKLDDYEIEEYDVEQELLRDEKIQIIDNTYNRARSRLLVSDMLPRDFDGNVVPKYVKRNELQNKNLDITNRHYNGSCKKEFISNVYEHVKGCSLKSNDSEQNYENFLECKGLSSKSIVKLSDNVSSKKRLIKPDVHLRSQMKLNRNYVKGSRTTVKY